jgi:hypothetical protein
MSGNYQGGQKKDFKADPIKLYLSARSYATAWAKDLCVAGKIELSQIPDYTDRMTVLQYGQMSTDPKVDAEVMRIAARIQARVHQAAQELLDRQNLCLSCEWGRETGTDECEAKEQDMLECTHYSEQPKDDDMEQHAANERTWEREEQERQAAEEDAVAGTSDQMDTGKPGDISVYKCGTCNKTYKTLRGLEQHTKKVHEVPA